jgi:hypothetical protein
MMGIEESDIKEVIGRWVEHTLQMEVKYTIKGGMPARYGLNIPYKWR